MTLAEKLTQVAENVPKVHDAGKKAQYDEFWASVESSIKAKGYAYAFVGKAWNADTFKPTFDIAPTGSANSMFYASNIENIKQSLEDCGVELNMSQATNGTNAFNVTATTALPKIIFGETCTQHQYVFAYSSNLQSIDEVRFKEGLAVTNCFQNCDSLKHVIFSGVISVSGLNLQWSKGLDKESIVSIIEALSLNTSGLSITLSKTAVNTAFGINVDDETTFPEGSEYYTLRHSKDNWTVNYI